jgi:DinB superfamily
MSVGNRFQVARSLLHRPLGWPRAALPIAPPVEERALLALYDEFDRWLASDTGEWRSARVSGWSRAEHVRHVLAANAQILAHVEELLGDGGADAEPCGPSCAGWIVLLSGWIPRGRGEAPASVRPSGTWSAAQLCEELQLARAQLGRVLDEFARSGRSQARRRHAAFGALDAGQWVRYARIHALHHARIARELRGMA